MTEPRTPIRCRAKVSPACYDGRDAEPIYGEDTGMEGDGTFDGQTVVCDPCYMKLGGPTHAQLRELGL